MKKISGKLSKIITILIVLLLFLYATNPSKADFVEYSKNEISDYVISKGITSNSFINSLISTIAGQATSLAAEIVYNRTDYAFFSVYKISSVDFEYQYLGILNKFFIIKDSNNSNKINNLFRDIVNIISKQDSLQEDEYMTYSFEVSEPRDIEISIESISGPDFEVLFFDNVNFDKYKKMLDGGSSDGIKVISQYEVQTNSSQNYNGYMVKGEYYLIVDNTDRGIIIPPMNFSNDIITYKIKIDLK